MPYFESPDCKIYYQKYGDQGQWVTLINGYTRSSRDFSIFVKKLLSAKFKVLILDNRGSGKTTCKSPHKFTDYVQDTIAIWKELGIEKSHLIGISMGGWICQHIAANFGKKVTSLVLTSTSPEIRISKEEPSFGNSLKSIKIKLNQYFSEDYALKNQLLIEAMAKEISKNNQDNDFDLMAKAQRAALVGFELSGLAEKISSPSLIIHGEMDRILSIEHALKLNSLIKNSKIHKIPKAGHLILAESPKEFYQTCIQFFNDQNREIQ